MPQKLFTLLVLLTVPIFAHGQGRLQQVRQELHRPDDPTQKKASDDDDDDFLGDLLSDFITSLLTPGPAGAGSVFSQEELRGFSRANDSQV